MKRILVAGLTAVLALLAAGPAAADPLHCVVVYDSSGHPIDTVCVPGT